MDGFKEKLWKEYDQKWDGKGVSGLRLAERLAELAQIGRTADGGSRRIGFSLEEKEAKQRVKNWMQEAGLEVREDEAGNVFGRLSGRDETLPVVMSGSHVDTVPNGGHFDGTLGVLCALEVAESWKKRGFQPRHPFEVAVFSDEEGARFNGGLTGSQAFVGEIDLNEQKKLRDIHGEPFCQVLQKVGLDGNKINQAARDLSQIAAFVEVHIEQGRRLEKAGVPVGVVSGIAGPCWLELQFHGEAGHAGNTPMAGRKDALVAASRLISKLPQWPGLYSESAVATAGKLEVKPNGVNVIPGEVRLYVDVRDIHAAARDRLVDRIVKEARQIGEALGVAVTARETLRVEPVAVDKALSQKLEETITENGLPSCRLPSGAGHDAMILGRHVPMAMLFVRSRGGISHHPDEWTDLADAVAAARVLVDFLEKLAGSANH